MKRTKHIAVLTAAALILAVSFSGCTRTAAPEPQGQTEESENGEATGVNQAPEAVSENTSEPVETGEATGGVNQAPEAVSENTTEPAETGEKTELILCGIGLEGTAIQSIINDFNRSSSSCFVVLKDYYTEVESLDQAFMRMQTEALSGGAADLICFEGISPLQWIAAGLLLDLDTFISADAEIQAEDLLIWDALHEYGGMYLCAPAFYVETLSCSADTLRAHEGWTIEEYLQVEKQLGANQDMTYGMTPAEFIRHIGGRYLRTALDLQNATCDLTTEEFRSVLNGTVQTGEYEASYDPNKNVPQRIISGDLICCYVRLTSGAEVAFDRYRCGETLSYIGWPTPDGSNGYDVTLSLPVGISAGTANQEACWTFIKYLLQHPYLENSSSGTPTYAPLLDTQLRILNENKLPYETTMEDISIVTDLARSCKTMSFYDETALEIIMEEAAGLVQNQIDMDTAIDRIQSRVSLYMSEQYG